MQAQSTSPAGQQVAPHKLTLHYRISPGPAITMMTPADPGFDEALSANFAGFVSRPMFNDMHPFLVILRNDTEKTVRAYDVVWSYGDPSGGTTAKQLLTEEMTTPLELSRPGGSPTDDNSIRPGEVRLVSPWFSARSGKVNPLTFTDKQAALEHPQEASQVKATLDCVVFGDGTYFGPNANKLPLRYFIARDAQHDEALTVWRALQRSPENPELENQLNRRIGIASSANPNTGTPLSLYVQARGRAAMEFETLFHKKGYEGLEKSVESMVSFMPPYQSFTTLGGRYHVAPFYINGVRVTPKD